MWDEDLPAWLRWVRLVFEATKAFLEARRLGYLRDLASLPGMML